MGQNNIEGKRPSHALHREAAVSPVRDIFTRLGRQLPVEANATLAQFGLTRGDLLYGRYDHSEIDIYNQIVSELEKAGYITCEVKQR